MYCHILYLSLCLVSTRSSITTRAYLDNLTENILSKITLRIVLKWSRNSRLQVLAIGCGSLGKTMQPVTYTNNCPGIATGLPAYLFTQVMQTLLTTQCFFGNPEHYPDDFGEKLKGEEEFDFIVVGGGSSGSIIANRLSEVENWKVLLVEAGGTPTYESDIPGFTFSSYGSEIDWNYKSEPDERSCLSMEGNRCALTKGKVLGGSSVLNFMHYTRGNPKDYDEWESLGNKGWSFEHVLPYFKKTESVHKDFSFNNDTQYDETLRHIRKIVINNEKSTYEFSKLIPEDYHSYDGILPVNHFSYDFYLAPLKKMYCFAIDQVGLDCISDVNGSNQTGFTYAMGTLTQGTRANSAKVFLAPVKSRPNLFVARNTVVERLIMKNDQVVGVELNRGNAVKKVFAKKEVVLSAGVFNSPQILMLSGIGPRKHLESFGIKVVKDLPGVGQNLQTHLTFFGLPVSIDKDVPEPLKFLQKLDGMYEFLTRGSGLYGNICMNDFIGFVSTKEKSTLPDIQFFNFLNHINDTYLFNELFRGLGVKSEIIDQLAKYTSESKVMLICPSILRPDSRGKVELKSAKPQDPPRILTNFLAEKSDVDTLLRGINLAVKLLKAEGLDTMQATMLYLKVSGCEDKDVFSRDYWKCLMKHLSTATHDYAGTCKMGTDDESVVDNVLKVYGVKGLRVADSSIMPNIIRGSTHIADIMIGERVSDFIKEQWENHKIHDEM